MTNGLFDIFAGAFRPATRKQDPLTSFVAEEKITKSGKRQSHCQIILETLRKHSGSTSFELAYFSGLRPDQVWRRRKDLEKYITIEGERNGCGLWWLI